MILEAYFASVWRFGLPAFLLVRYAVGFPEARLDFFSETVVSFLHVVSFSCPYALLNGAVASTVGKSAVFFQSRLLCYSFRNDLAPLQPSRNRFCRVYTLFVSREERLIL
jgi:hypothetical protein